MRRFILTISVICCAAFCAVAQDVTSTPAGGTSTAAKKPTIMVVPGDQFCNANGYMKEYDNFGETVKYPDYNKALLEDSELGIAISKLGELMSDRGFNLKLLSATLKTIANNAAEDALLTSKDTGAQVAESPIDKLKKTAKADIIMQLNWKIGEFGSRKTIEYNLQGVDAYTDKQIAAASGVSMPSNNPSAAALLIEQVAVHMDQFCSQLQEHFNNLFEQGREVTIRCKRFEDSDVDFETEFDGDELGMIIEDYLAKNTVGGRFTTADATENQLNFEQVRIPMVEVSESGRERAVDARYFARGLAKKITEVAGVECKVMTKGLGEATIVLGGK